MPYFTYDTSVIISRRFIDLRDRTSGFVLSSVVLLELIAGAEDDSQRKLYEFVCGQYERDKSLIVPNGSDWLLASKILFWLTRRRRRVEGGRLHRLHPGMSQRMALDTLLAVSARRWNATVITENWIHFKAIQRFCNVKLIKASDFFT
jgi:predicted nucleic acid-binding protein